MAQHGPPQPGCRVQMPIRHVIDTCQEFLRGPRLLEYKGVRKSNLEKAKQIRIDFATHTLLPVIVENTYEKLLHPLPQLYAEFTHFWGILQSKPKTWIENTDDAAYLKRVEELSASVNHILSNYDEDTEPPHEALTQCILECWTMSQKECDSLIYVWLVFMNAGYADPMAKRAAEQTGNKWWKDEVEDEIQGDECFETFAKGKRLPVSALSPVLRLIGHFAQYMESALAITTGLISFSTRNTIRTIDISIIIPHHPYLIGPSPFRYLPLQDSASESRCRLHVHAEVQLALFYASHPSKKPFHNLMGLSHHACYACDLFLKFLQAADDSDRYTQEAAGPPIRILYRGTSCRVYNNWSFPILPQSEELSVDDEKRLENRLKLISEDMIVEMAVESEKLKQKLAMK
ncbi:hypothetical protein M422DRAFT_67159 [Sphaerobolus stellatus SS14]|uniref:Unplaced genomic scaffold SPHSTscaffold_36, whole genome shotgun sequence n=1 Tax=Sphaerobolus stellatus (strain SS14) TaxID=990650 RepID=A0A0C9VFD7_SPHS4|nr:hypothetical protein M422DRAFT_67159 [Sphaerobolus stellatus SS14]